MKRILSISLMMISLICLLTACGARSRLSITMNSDLKDVEAMVSVADKSGKEIGGGNVTADGPLVLSVKDGTYTITMTLSSDAYIVPDPETIDVKNIAYYEINLEPKETVIEETAAVPDDDIPETIEAFEPGPEPVDESVEVWTEPALQELGDVLLDEKEAPYAEILDLHKQAIAEKWDGGQYMDHDMSFLFGECKTEDQIGFSLMYMDDSEYPMLLMGTLTGEDFTDSMILDAYYLLEDGTMKHVFSSGDRYRYYWMPDEAGPQLIAFEGSDGAARSYNYYYRIDKGELSCVQGIVSDFDADPENPWYQVYTADYSIEGGEKVSEEYATEIITEYAKQYRKVPFRPLTDGYDLLAD